MITSLRTLTALTLGTVTLILAPAASGQITTHSNTAAITIPVGGVASPYPSVINVSGATTSINHVTVRLLGLTHTFPGDLQVLLVAPGGQRIILMSAAGTDFDVSGVNLTFTSDAVNTLLFDSQIFPGTYAPQDFSTFSLPSPAPARPYTDVLSTLHGLNANGTWTLYVYDSADPDGGSIAGGWSLTFNETIRQPAAVGTAMTYQGRLTGAPANGEVFMRFGLWDHPDSSNAVNRVGGAPGRSVTLVNSVFTTTVDFGFNIQRQRALYIEIEVANTAGGPFTTLTPRQPLTGAPLALQLKGVTVDTANQVGVGGIDDPQFTFESNGRMRVRGVAGFNSNFSPGVWFSSPSAAGVQVNRGLVGAADDTTLGFFTSGVWPLTVNASGNTLVGNFVPGALSATERLTVSGNVQLNTPGRLSFGPVGNFTSTTENTDAVFFQRSNPLSNFSELRLNLGDDAGGGDAFTITTTTNGTTFTERYRFSSDGNAFKPGGGSWAVLSDASTKDNVAPMTGTLDKLLSLHGYAFHYKPEFVAAGRALPGPQIGLVAQDVQKVFPEWVGTGADGKLFVSERATTALMVEALRDLRAEKDRQIDALRAQRDAESLAKQREIDALKARLATLEAALARLTTEK